MVFFFLFFFSGGSGKLYAIGANGQGQLGLNDFLDRSTASLISSSFNAMAVSSGSLHVLAVGMVREESLFLAPMFMPPPFQDGALFSWGKNSVGQLGLGSLVNSPTPAGVAIPGLVAIGVSCGALHSAVVGMPRW